MIKKISHTGKEYSKPEDRFELEVYEGRATNYRGDIIKWRKYEREFHRKREELKEKGFLHIIIRKISRYNEGIVRVTDYEGLLNVYDIILNSRKDSKERIALFKKYQNEYIKWNNDKVLNEILDMELDDIVNEYDDYIRNKKELEEKKIKNAREGKARGGRKTKSNSQKVFEETEFIRKHHRKSKERRYVDSIIGELKNAQKY